MKNMTCVVVAVLCNQSEASDLGDNQSRYLCTLYMRVMH